MSKKILPKIFLWVVLSAFLFSCANDADSADSKEKVPVNVKFSYTQEETELMTIINNYRISKGLNALETIDFISAKSEEHDNYMISVGQVSHDYFQDRYESLVKNLGAKNVSENLAYNYATPQGVFNAWMKSSGHAANIEGDFTHFGIAIRANSEGKKFYTNLFMKK